MRDSDPRIPPLSSGTAAWAGSGRLAVWQYARTTELRPAEATLLPLAPAAFSGDCLEVGSGAGRVTGHLLARGARVLGLDVSEAMVRHCRRRFPAATFARRDLRDLDGLGPFDGIVAAYNVLDVLDDPDRRAWLRAARARLRPGGALLFSTHNLAWADAGLLPGPTHVRWAEPLRALWDAARVPSRVLNHRRTRSEESRQPGYARLADSGMDFQVVHYYVGRTEQEVQLRDAGFEVAACADHEGVVLPPGEPSPASPDLHFLATVVG